MNKKIYKFFCSNYHDDESIDVVAPKPLRDAGKATTQAKYIWGISGHPDCPSDDRCSPE
ncbi:MAG: hypothetical protein LM581_02660 [Desulfurococcales archaeon]|nr:hypothetical protein [Desulfurococcales archaeon]